MTKAEPSALESVREPKIAKYDHHKGGDREGLVELFYDESSRECVRITPEGEKFEFST